MPTTADSAAVPSVAAIKTAKHTAAVTLRGACRDCGYLVAWR